MMLRRKRSYSQYRNKELALQCDSHDYLTAQYYNRLKWHHSPNEGKRNFFQQYVIKHSGVSKGFPDFIIHDKKQPERTLALELKWEDNLPTTEQVEWLEFLLQPRKGCLSAVTWSLNGAMKVVDLWVRLYDIGKEFTVQELGKHGLVNLNGQFYVWKDDLIPQKYRKLFLN